MTRPGSIVSAARMARALTPRSFARYAAWRARDNPSDIRVRLRSGLVVEVRGGSGDFWTLSEIFFNRQYRPPAGAPEDVRTVVDTGANVGYASLWFLQRYPRCRVTAFEPLPAHVAQLERHLVGNGLRGRADVVPAAAAVAPGRAVFADAGPESRPAAEGVEVAVVDWFARLPAGTLDVLKLDIEGGEVALFDDPRFAGVAARTRLLVVEWHEPAGGRGGREWCAARLRRAGLTVTHGPQYEWAGLLWGVNDAAPAARA